MRKRGQAWPVGVPVEEGSFRKDQILQEEYELPLIGTSRASGQRGSERDVVRKRRRSHAGAIKRGSGKRQGDERHVEPISYPLVLSLHRQHRQLALAAPGNYPILQGD